MSARAFIVHQLWIGFLVGLMGIVGGLVIAKTQLAPDCPQEDSCTVQYYDHQWHIREVGR